MTEVGDPRREPAQVRRDPATRAQARRLTTAIAKIGFVLPGTLSRRHTRCGRPGCHCHADPPQLHGPYWWWTRKVQAKTVTRLLTDEQAADYGEWFNNARHLRALIAELEALSLAVVENDPRSARRPGGRRPAIDTPSAVDKPRSPRR